MRPLTQHLSQSSFLRSERLLRKRANLVAVVVGCFWSEVFAQDGAASATTTTVTSVEGVTTTWLPGTFDPARYTCETKSCKLFNDWEWFAINTSNSTMICDEAHQDLFAFDGYFRTLPSICRAYKATGETYEGCRKNYCNTFDNAMQKILHLGGPGYYGFDQCRPFLDFNRTLCETEYRDPEIFCDCYCPTMTLLEPIPGCEDEILAFLLLGRRSPELARMYPMTAACAADLCRWYEIIGDPLPANPPDMVGGVPNICHEVGLPFRPQQCEELVTTIRSGMDLSYDPCPWLTPGEEDDVLICSDGSTHELDVTEAESWTVCIEHGFRWTCPANYPVMCEDRNCDASLDHCCQTETWRCKSGKERMCSPALARDLPEWNGFLTPDAASRRVLTTTLDPLQQFLSRSTTTTLPEGFAGEVKRVMPIIVWTSGAIGATVTLCVCIFLCRTHLSNVSKTVTGAPRFLKAYRTDPVSVFWPKNDVSQLEKQKLPPLRTKEEIEAERLDRQACEGLRAAVDAAYQRGFRGLCSYDGAPPPAEEEALLEAMATVRVRGLESKSGNGQLLVRGERWLRTLRAERHLMRVAADLRPIVADLGVHGLGGIGGTTLIEQKAQAGLMSLAWAKVENLTVAIKEAKLAGAQESLVSKEEALLAEAVARVPELPNDRVILDPEGEGLKLLPRGHKRAVDKASGSVYYYNSQTGEAGNVGDDPPPREELGDVDIAASRPCCAEWVRSRTCKGGRRCPWRHEMPRPGDPIRECILARDDDR